MTSKNTESSFPRPYEIQIDEDKYRFVTDRGIEYILTLFDLSSIFVFEGEQASGLLYEFAFGPEREGNILWNDPRIYATII